MHILKTLVGMGMMVFIIKKDDSISEITAYYTIILDGHYTFYYYYFLNRPLMKNYKTNSKKFFRVQ